MSDKSSSSASTLNRRVVVTGIGIVSSQGVGTNNFWENLISGKPRIGFVAFPGINKDKYLPYAAEIKDFKFGDHLVESDLYKSYMDRGLQFGLVAAKEAYDISNVASFRNKIDNDRFGIYIATTTGGLTSACEKAEKYVKSKDINSFDERSFYSFSPGVWPLVFAHYFKTNGPAKSFCISCCAGGESIGQCYRDIKHGDIDIGICGGCDAPIVLINYLSFFHIKATSRWRGDPKGACRPFSRDRSGMVFGEGGAFLVLEDLELAVRRNARIYAEIIGYGATSDGYHMVAPFASARQWKRAIELAVNEARIRPEMIDYVSCHGTGTVQNDSAETLALKKALGSHAYNTPIGSIKGMIGHAFGAATAIEVIGLIKTLETGIAPPTINYAQRDENCDLDCVPNVARKIKCDHALKTATGFGGSNIALLVKSYA